MCVLVENMDMPVDGDSSITTYFQLEDTAQPLISDNCNINSVSENFITSLTYGKKMQKIT